MDTIISEDPPYCEDSGVHLCHNMRLVINAYRNSKLSRLSTGIFQLRYTDKSL